MPEARDLPLFRWGEELRRLQLQRQRRRGEAAAAGLAGGAIALLLWTSVWEPRPLLLWNSSASMTPGLYAVGPARRISRGDILVARLPGKEEQLAAERGYLPAELPLVKRAAALGGDRVCAAGEALWINGRLAARRRETDRQGRPMPWWSGCRELQGGELLLLTEREDSFDGRYFGPVNSDRILGKARLLWRA